MFYFPLYPFECIEIREWKCKTAPVIKWTGCRLIGLRFNLFPRRGSEIVLFLFILPFWNVTLHFFLLYFNPMNYCLDICWDYLKYRSTYNVMDYIVHFLFNMNSFLFTNLQWNRVNWIFNGQYWFIIRIYYIFKQNKSLKNTFFISPRSRTGNVSDLVANGAYISVVKQDNNRTNKAIKIAQIELHAP